MSTKDREKDTPVRQSSTSRGTEPQLSLGLKSKYFSPDRIKLPLVLNGEAGLRDLDSDGAEVLHASGSSRHASKKRNVSEVSGFSKPPGKKKKPSRPYAPPENYAHLAHLPDYLKGNLDGK